MLAALGMAGLQGGLSLISGMGAQQSAKKQGRLQMMEDARMDALNMERQALVNQANRDLGRELLTVEEKTTVADNSWQRTQGNVDLAAFMAAGEAAGFNPVTWLNSGALSLYGNTFTENGGSVTTTKMGHNAADAYRMMMPGTVMGTPSQIPKVPSMMEVFGNAGTAALGTFRDQYNKDQSQAFQSSLLDRQLTAMAQRQMGGGSSGTGGLYQTSYGTSVNMGGRAGGSGMLSGGTSSGSKAATSLPYPASWERGDVEVTNPHRTWAIDKDTPNAEAYEDRYAEVWANIFGTYNVLADTVRQATGKSIREWGKAANMNVGDYKSVGDWWKSTYGKPRSTGVVTPYVPPGMSPGTAYNVW